MRLSALSLPDKTPETKGECMSDRGRPIGLHTYTTRARSGHGSQISLPVFRGRRRWALNGTMGGAQSRAPYMQLIGSFTSGSLATRRSITGNLIGQCEVIL